MTQVRRQLKQTKTKRPRGRPSGKQAKQIARKNKQVQKKIAELFEHRHLFVKHTLAYKEKKILQRITRGLDQLRTLWAIMDEAYRLFDRRCRMDTALEKLAKLRRRIRRFVMLRDTLKKLWSPNLEKALGLASHVSMLASLVYIRTCFYLFLSKYDCGPPIRLPQL